jgi:L-asparaginase
MIEIHFYTAGGTIDKTYFDRLSTYEVDEPCAETVLRDARVTLKYKIFPLFRKDSLDMTDDDRKILYDRIATDTSSQIVITHGTDTIVETGHFLKNISDKTICLTGALAPARFRETDASFNIGCAITAVQILPPGIYITMNGRIFDINAVRKDREKGCFVEL